jgi:hypothetical protein
MEFEKETVQGLLKAYSEILRELRRRNLIRSTNNPVADIAETLVAVALKLELVEGSTAGHDAISTSDGLRYEIKGRRITSENKSRQLSFIRGLDKDHFDFLVGVLFDEDFQILKACIIPRSTVQKLAKYVKHVNGWRLILTDSVWNETGVKDMSETLRLLLSKLEALPTN